MTSSLSSQLSRLLILPFLSLTVFAQADTKLPPIRLLENVGPSASVLDDSGTGVLLVVRSKQDAADHFSEEQLAKLLEKVDFNHQIALVFAWRGSGQDRLEHVVMESLPEQVQFTIRPGRTRDLRVHTRVFALRSNVKWRLVPGRQPRIVTLDASRRPITDPSRSGGRGGQSYLAPDGKLRHPLILRDSQTGFAGDSGHIWTVARDGSWRHQTFLNEMLRKPENEGKFTNKQLQELVRQMAKSDLLGLPERMGKDPGVNPHVFSVSFGNKQYAMILQGGAPIPKPDPEDADSPEQRFASLVRWLQRSFVADDGGAGAARK